MTETNIVAFCGKKQSGKSTSCNFLYGHSMQLADETGELTQRVNDQGLLVTSTQAIGADGKIEKGEGVLDVNQKSYEWAQYAGHYIWPYVKSFSFAEALKDICTEVLGLAPEQCHGTDAEKNTYTHLLWENMPGIQTVDPTPSFEVSNMFGQCYHAAGPMTGREVMQFVGTDVFRKMYDAVWVNFCMKQILIDQPKLAVIPDCRFPNEVAAVREAGGKVIHLLGDFAANKSGDGHESENALDGVKVDAVIDNRTMDLHETNNRILEILTYWKYTQHIRQPRVTSTRAPKEILV